MEVKQKRSLIAYLLLSIITLGIYALFFWHKYAQDVNTICAGDGKQTRGYIVAILLSIVTLGIYGLVWTYGMQNRLRDNANRYGAGLVRGGGTILAWQIFGALLFGIGPFVAMYIQIDSINRLAYGYASQSNESIARKPAV